jgi:hypothetical protein
VLNEAYDPLIDAARSNSTAGPELLRQLGEKLFAANHDRLASIEDGIRAAKRNLVLYASFFPPDVVETVSVYYGLNESLLPACSSSALPAAL